MRPSTVHKWGKRTSVSDAPMGPKAIHPTVPTIEEEATIVTFRRHTLLPLDDCFYALQPSIPHLTRSALHCCLQRHGISRLPDVGGDKPEKFKSKTYRLAPSTSTLPRYAPRKASSTCSSTPSLHSSNCMNRPAGLLQCRSLKRYLKPFPMSSTQSSLTILS